MMAGTDIKREMNGILNKNIAAYQIAIAHVTLLALYAFGVRQARASTQLRR
jgi:hypothetical protein